MSEAAGARQRPAAHHAETRRDVDAALAARMELGPQFEEHIAAGLAERVEELVAYRTAELRQQAQLTEQAAASEKQARTHRFVLGIVSVGAGIPITAISATNVEPGLLGVAMSWLGLVGINAVHALGDRRRP